MLSTIHPVCIVGAGPIGLACALRFASLGVPSVLLEAKPHPIRQGSKACLIQGDVLEVLDKFGCGEKVAEEGIAWRIGHTYIRGQEVDQIVYQERLGFSQFVNISQFRIEQIMLEKLEGERLCDILWGHEAVGIVLESKGVIVRVRSSGEMHDLHFRYLIACDGIHSKIRNLLDIRWTGYTHKDRFLITDIYTKLPLTKERHFHFDPPFNPGRQLVIHPQPNDMWRIDWQLPPEADIEKERETGELDKRIRAVIGNIPYRLDWLSTYRFNQRVVNRFKVGHVFLAGDAAHALPPYGSRGMNSGIQDIDNLAWKLALVLEGKADESLLTTYHEERYRAAKENLRVTEATLRFMVPPTRLKRWIRNMLLTLSRPFPAFRKLLNSGKMAEPFRYTESEIVEDASGHPLAGAFAPDGAVVSHGRKARLRRLFGAEFVFLYICSTQKEAAAFASLCRDIALHDCLRVVAVLPAGTETGDLPAYVEPVFHDDPMELRSYSGEGPAWYLVRSDGHVAAVGDLLSDRAPADVFARCSRIAPDAAFSKAEFMPSNRPVAMPARATAAK